MIQIRLPVGFLLAVLMIFTNSGFSPRFQDATAVPDGSDQAETVITSDTEPPDTPDVVAAEDPPSHPRLRSKRHPSQHLQSTKLCRSNPLIPAIRQTVHLLIQA